MNKLQDSGTPNIFATLPLESVHPLDAGPACHRMGVIILASDYVSERDFRMMLPGDDVAMYVNRIRNVNPVTAENLLTMAPRLTDAVSMILPDGRLDAIAYCCTSGTVVIGFDAIAASVHAVRPQIPVTTPMTASVAGLARFDVRKLSVLTPYNNDLNRAIAGHIESTGLEIVAFSGFLMDDDNEMARISPDAIFDAAIEADRPDADALFISCTAIRAVEVVERIEQALGKPVISANQALFWQTLRATGYEGAVEGFGQLLRLGSGQP